MNKTQITKDDLLVGDRIYLHRDSKIYDYKATVYNLRDQDLDVINQHGQIKTISYETVHLSGFQFNVKLKTITAKRILSSMRHWENRDNINKAVAEMDSVERMGEIVAYFFSKFADSFDDREIDDDVNALVEQFFKQRTEEWLNE